MRGLMTSVLAAALALISLTTITAHAREYTKVCDVNRDEVIDVSDGVLYSRYVMNDQNLVVDKYCFEDCNGDGEKSLADVVFILQFIARVESTESTDEVESTTTVEKTTEEQSETQTIETQEDETQTTTTTNTTVETTVCVQETEETVSTQTEKRPEPVEEVKEGVIIIQGQEFSVYYGPATQKNVDKHDVVLDTELFSKGNASYLFGHNTGAFWWLKYVTVGETITIKQQDSEQKYKVTTNQIGNMTRDEKEIVFEDGTCVIDKAYDQQSIILITCVGGMKNSLRRVVIATIE